MRTSVFGARSLLRAAYFVALSGASCGDDDSSNNDAALPPALDASVDATVAPTIDAAADAMVAAGPVLPRPSQSTSVDISPDDRWVVMVNREDDSVSVFDTTLANARTATVATGEGSDPYAVVVHPDGKTAFVALRGAAAVIKISGLDTATPTISASLGVGSEPTGLALAPSGSRLFVAEHAEGSIAVIDTASMAQVGLIEGPDHPYALAVTNDLDAEDADETLIAPEFFGVPAAGGVGETKDNGRTGLVRRYALADLSPLPAITLAPLDSGFPRTPAGAEPLPTVLTSPNQLSAVSVFGARIYITSISASPVGPTNFNTNVQPVVYVADLATGLEVKDAFGSTNLAKLVVEQIPAGRLFLADLAGIAFVQSSELIAYTVSTGADAVQRVRFAAPGAAGPLLGSSINSQIDLLTKGVGGCQNPTGIVTRHADNNTLYVSCWASRQLGVVDLAKQELAQKIVASAPAVTGPEQTKIDLGRRFFFTGRGRWSSEAWSSCGSCHPGGLTDNITWGFPAGPRQTVALDGTFSHFPGKPQKQRILNYSAIFDEMHDFERNTRAVSGGLGAITTAAAGECGMLAKETPQMVSGDGVGQPVKELQGTAGNCTVDFDDIEAWVKTIRPTKALQRIDPALVTRGRAVFQEGNCATCHGGSGWSVSRLFFVPSSAGNLALQTTPLVVPAVVKNLHSFQLAPEPPLAVGGMATPPNQIACVIRNVKTFGVFGDAAATTALEVKNSGMARAQGEGGYNVPSLYGMALDAPYLHHGQAASLEALFTSGAFTDHLRAGNANFLTNDATAPADRAALIAFVTSIDATTAELDIPASYDICPVGP
jgi:mono/diheme cytochrome c family protein